MKERKDEESTLKKEVLTRQDENEEAAEAIKDEQRTERQNVRHLRKIERVL